MAEVRQVLKGIAFGVWYSQHHIIHSFLIIPVGILVLLTILYGFNVLLTDTLQVKFPSSVLGMLINLVWLCILSACSNLDRGSRVDSWGAKVSTSASWILEHYLMVTKPLMNFCLKWINVFFIPSFIILPLSDHISFIECLKIAAVFVIGFVALMVFNVYLIMALKYLLQSLGVYSFNFDKPEESGRANSVGSENDEEIELFDLNRPYISVRNDITTIDLTSLRPSKTEPSKRVRSLSTTENPFDYDPRTDPDIQRYFSRIDPARPSFSPSTPGTDSSSLNSENPSTIPNENQSTTAQDTNLELSPTTKAVAIFITNYIDWFLYLALFFISQPFYYINAIHVMLPYHLGLTILSYYVALLIPAKFPKTKPFAHPILVLTFEILLVCFIGSMIFHRGSPKGFLEDLRYYKTGKNYLNLFNGEALYSNGELVPASVLASKFTSEPMWPGAGDFLSSLMDVSIVALSLPIFTHRRDFVKNFWMLAPTIIISMALTFICYPIVCYKIGISQERSLGYIGRLVTLALGTPLVESLGGSISLMAVCTILSGICGVLIGDSFFRLLRVPSNDFVTRGITLGINCGAISTAHLLNVDPRAASMSSLSFSVFGALMVVLASIGALRDIIRSSVGL